MDLCKWSYVSGVIYFPLIFLYLHYGDYNGFIFSPYMMGYDGVNFPM